MTGSKSSTPHNLDDDQHEEGAESSSELESDPELPNPITLDLDAHNALWAAETELRMRTAGCTHLEAKCLKDVSPPLLSRLLELYFDAASPAVARVWLNQRLSDEDHQYVAGQSLRASTVEWSLAKAMLLQVRANLPPRSMGYTCFCLPEAAFFPSGCVHKPVPSGDGFRDCCRLCSRCLRCQRPCKKWLLPAAESCNCRPAGLVGLEWKH